jgi:hypothetical protein
MKNRMRGLVLLTLLAIGLLAACQQGSPAMDAAATAAAPAASAATGDDSAGDPAPAQGSAASPANDADQQADDEGASNRCGNAKPHPQIGKLAAEFDVPEDVIAGYLCDDGLSPGAIRVAFRIAGQSGETVDAVLAMRADGLGWGEIRAELGLTPDDDTDDDTGD